MAPMDNNGKSGSIDPELLDAALGLTCLHRGSSSNGDLQTTNPPTTTIVSAQAAMNEEMKSYITQRNLTKNYSAVRKEINVQQHSNNKASSAQQRFTYPPAPPDNAAQQLAMAQMMRMANNTNNPMMMQMSVMQQMQAQATAMRQTMQTGPAAMQIVPMPVPVPMPVSVVSQQMPLVHTPTSIMMGLTPMQMSVLQHGGNNNTTTTSQMQMQNNNPIQNMHILGMTPDELR